jgi:hypothetical protein
MKTRIFEFNGNEISFSMDEENNLMVNATEMAKPFNKKVEAFMRNEDTQSFISECLKSENSRYIWENSNEPLKVLKEEDLYVSSQKSGTWMHRILALKFAAWLSPSFELWVYSTIETLLFGRYVEREQSLERSLKLEKEKATLINKPASERTGEDFERFLEIDKLLKTEKSTRKNLTTESISEIKGLFDQ